MKRATYITLLVAMCFSLVLCGAKGDEVKIKTVLVGSADKASDSMINAKGQTCGMPNARITRSNTVKIGEKYVTTIQVEYVAPVKISK